MRWEPVLFMSFWLDEFFALPACTITLKSIPPTQGVFQCFTLFAFSKPANNLVVWCFLLWNYMYFVFNTHMYMYNYSLYFPWFFSPLWEMAQEGIDIKTIQWSQHWATGPAPLPPPNSTWTPSLGLLSRPSCCVLFNFYWYYQDIKLHLSLLLCENGWMWSVVT